MNNRPCFAAVVFVTAVAGSLCSLAGKPVSAADTPRNGPGPSVLVVFDGSGSMWGKLEGDKGPKFYAVREALRRSLPQLSPDANVGLMSFGHRRKGDCSDVELVVPPEGRDIERFMSPLEKLNPKGKGPLVVAIREAAKSLAGRRNASIILIHDGPDNCQQDACAAAAEIARSQPGLPIHTIAIALDAEDWKKTSCVATATGGRAFEPDDLGTLDSAVADAVKLANLDTGGGAAKPVKPLQSTAPVAPPASPPSPVPGVPGLAVFASLGSGGPPVTVPVHWRVFKADGQGPPLLETNSAQLVEPLASGTYVVEAQLGLASVRQTVEVGAKVGSAVRLVLDAGVITPSARAFKNSGIMEGTTYSVREANPASGGAQPRTLWIGRSGGTDIVLPAGTYTVRAEVGQVVKEETATLAPGSRTPVEFVLGSGRLELTVALTDDGPPIENAVIIVSEDDSDAPSGRREVSRSAAPRPEFVLPAGTYYVTARHGSALVRQRIAVGAGDIVKRTIALGLARVELTTKVDSKIAAAQIAISSQAIRLDGDKSEAARSTAPNPVFLLPAGRYRLESRLGSQNVRADRTIDIRTSDPQHVSVALDGGQITLKLRDNAASVTDQLWEVRDSDERIVWRTTQSEAKMILAPGRYMARVDVRDRRLERAFDVKPGEQTTIAVELK